MAINVSTQNDKKTRSPAAMYEGELKTHDSSDREVKGRKRFRLRFHCDVRVETQVQ